MEKYIPYEKMSKKAQREHNKKQRKDWGGISPVTRCPQNPKAYNRAKSKRDRIDSGHAYVLYSTFFKLFDFKVEYHIFDLVDFFSGSTVEIVSVQLG